MKEEKDFCKTKMYELADKVKTIQISLIQEKQQSEIERNSRNQI